jgi:predicted dithiol-disulfide oxidoreductase (DUF899 family)
MKTKSITPSNVVSPEKWLAARRELLREEKEFTRLRDRLSARRRALPWVKVEQPYVFDSVRGRVSLPELFEDRSQLLVYHFMLGPGWEEGCRSCSYVADHFDGTLPHLAARDVSLVAISRAPLDEILRFKSRMGWAFNWVSAHGSTFNQDFRVSFTPEEVEAGKANYNFGVTDIAHAEMPGLSVFARGADGGIYRTYSTYSRGLDLLIGTFNLLDLVPKGRDENPEEPMSWVRHHDRYEHVAVAN